jgi:Protein of unknown function (DUF2844)
MMAVDNASATLGQILVIQQLPVISIKKTITPYAISSSSYTVSELTLESGTVIKEFMDAQGIVFAVQWAGPVMPELADLLGIHFKTFQSHTEQIRSQGQFRASVNMTRSDVVVRSNGRMRNYYGSAYVPMLVPSQISIDDVFQ